MKRWWTVAWRSAAFFTLWGLLLAPAALWIGRTLEAGDGELSWLARLCYDGAGLVAILVAAWVMLRFVERRPLVSVGLEPGTLLREAATGLAVAAAMVLACLAVVLLGGWATLTVPPGISWDLLLLAALSMLLNAALQEMLCRSYVFQTIQRQGSTTAAIVLTSLLFALLHAGAIGGSFLAALNLFAAGILLGAAYASTGNLWLPTALHFGWNLLLGPVLGLSVSGQALDVGHRLFELRGPATWTGGAFGIEASLAATVATLGGIGLVALRHRLRAK